MTELLDRDVDEIKALHNQWIDLELSGGSSRLVDLCTEDIQWIPPNSPPLAGRQAIAEYSDNNQVDVKEIEITNLSIRGSGSVAYLTSDYLTQFLTHDSPEVHSARGTHLWILRKTESGEWRVAVVTWSSW
jgi:uncharacterized protein (TIGR02246 family)